MLFGEGDLKKKRNQNLYEKHDLAKYLYEAKIQCGV